jgi:alkylation response protein AidB-like acyl-CoA dehydrogenase
MTTNSQFLAETDRALLLNSLARYLEMKFPYREIERRDREHVPPYDALPAYGELGLLHFAVPNTDGYDNFDWNMVLDIQMQLAGHAYSLGSIYNRLVSFSVLPIAINGNADQRAKFLPKFLRGECFFGLALTEPEAGTSLKRLQTELVNTGGQRYLSGLKHWISDAAGASHLVVICRDPEQDGQSAVSAIVVPVDSPGISMSLMSKVGNNCMPSFQVQFNKVRVDDSWVLGHRGDGLSVLASTLRYSRASLAATCLGSTVAVLEHTKQYINERFIGRKRLAEFQVHRHRLVDFFARAHQLMLVLKDIAFQINGSEVVSKNMPIDAAASMAKVLGTELLQEVTNYCMQLHASNGYDANSLVARAWRDSRLFTFGEGANEMHRDNLAKHWID